MSLRLLVDEDTQGKNLVSLLRAAGHDVLTTNEAGLRTKLDPVVFARALLEQRIILTRNAEDYEALHEESPDHFGIIVVYQDRDRRKDLVPAAIVRCIANLESSGWDLAGQFVSLNAWNY